MGPVVDVLVLAVVVLALALELTRRRARQTREVLRLRDLELAALLQGLDAPVTLTPAADVAPGEQPLAVEQRETTATDLSGRVRYLRERRFPILDAGRLIAVASQVQDVSDQRAAAALADAATGQVHAFLNAAPDATLLVDDAGTIQYANAQVAILLGHFMDELVGSPVGRLVTGVEPVRRPMGRAEPARAHHRDGHTIEVDLALSPVSVGSGGPWTLVFLRDATVQLRAEQALRDAQERYRLLAEHDALTGLVNRRRFQVDLEGHLASCRAQEPHGALLAIDLDNFKAVNDTLGHHVGDHLVTAVAHALRGAVREGDVVARQGGDEFLVLLRDGGDVEATHIATRLLAAIGDGARMLPESLEVTGSIGIVAFGQVPLGDLTTEHVLIEADVAMYAAKHAGRGRAVSYQPPPAGRRRAGLAPAG